MKWYALLLILLSATGIRTEDSTSTAQQTGVNISAIYIQNNRKSDCTLTSFTILYSYPGSNREFSKTATTSITLPANSVTSIRSSMKISQTFEKTPHFKGLKQIEIDGAPILANDRNVGLGARSPIIVT
jgi:hypothetical protein